MNNAERSELTLRFLVYGCMLGISNFCGGVELHQLINSGLSLVCAILVIFVKWYAPLYFLYTGWLWFRPPIFGYKYHFKITF